MPKRHAEFTGTSGDASPPSRKPEFGRAAVGLVHLFAYPLLALSRIPTRVLGPMLAALPESDTRRPGRARSRQSNCPRWRP